MILVDAETGEEVEPVIVDAATGHRLDDSEAYVFAAGPAATGGMLARYGGSAPGPREARDPRDVF
ncbi:hypothetical protein SSPS47_17810 [Streptomyces sp. S4.7]|nr:hypothetical protein SSPS47_17810 [Streptomyces sp. S4.7]